MQGIVKENNREHRLSQRLPSNGLLVKITSISFSFFKNNEVAAIVKLHLKHDVLRR